LTSAQIEGHSIRREQGAEKKAWDAEPAYGTAMRLIALFSGLCVAAALTSSGSVFSHDFTGLERLPKLATSYLQRYVIGRSVSVDGAFPTGLWHNGVSLSCTRACMAAGARLQSPEAGEQDAHIEQHAAKDA